MPAKIFNKLQQWINVFTGLMLAFICVLVFVQVIMRYCFGRSLAWSEELARYLFIWVIYFGLNLAIRDEMETKVEIIDQFAGEKGRIVLAILRYLITLVVLAACFVSSLQLVKVGMKTLTSTLRIPAWIPYITFVVGFPMSFIEVCRRIYIYVGTLKAPAEKKEAVEA
jgi:TRAP-type C4-dicarboxylate transport system permease small subunit